VNVARPIETLVLSEFVYARIAEAQDRVDTIPDWVCTLSARGEGWGTRGPCPLCDRHMFDGTESVTADAFWEHYEDTHQRIHVLRECEAKRQIVAQAAAWAALCEPGGWPERGDMAGAPLADAGRWVLRVLAHAHHDHPDYQQEWAP
jgi:hypothetical protein